MTQDKAQVRADLLARGRAMTTSARADAAEAIALHVLAVPVVSRARRVACYLSMPSEPGTAPLIAALIDHGIEVVVPLSLADHSLEWVAHDPAALLVVNPLGIPEPDGPRLGAAALDTCGAVIVPALAVDHTGHRLGRGAGYYDRALAGVDRPVCALVFTHELLPEVPHEPHDVPVQMAVTPDGLFRVP
ncbi:5-formyltetrahydrofolate cyclo-ligase [Aeromicrobium sp.]|uniref:5-formyltetrahydrofolate cyclo-ligase n=1 Tax=Aeromicrobium sp. TaxID=1871063 RepID=UPI0019BA35DC|nr:5-formyltetrahydrofolate cyclo-ligase [Aeromicrobium sp.]MBC7631021.1 5-formyltetrahydrofolate cyclo-ligase [Aeromicrobium sp.]